MRFEIRHLTVYEYDHEVSLSHHIARLTPRELAHQHCVFHGIKTTPGVASESTHTDHFGNTATFFTIDEPHRHLEITAQSLLEIGTVSLVPAESTPAWESIRAQFTSESLTSPPAVAEFVFPSPLLPWTNELTDYAQVSFPARQSILAGAKDLCARIHQDFKFDPRATTVATTLGDFFRQRRGVCQDFAHLMVACLRTLGLPARYVSGYLETVPPPGQVKLVGADASHAWVAVWCGDAGWQDLDPTNNVQPTERHLTLAWGRDFADVSPVHGVVVGGGNHRLKVAVDVNSVAALPSVISEAASD